MDLKGKSIAILATHGFEQAELEVPRDRLKAAGAIVHVVSLAAVKLKVGTRRTGAGLAGVEGLCFSSFVNGLDRTQSRKSPGRC